MRHRVYGRHLGRNKDERTSLFKNLVRSLIISEKIETTQAKAKAIKGLVDRLVNQAKSPATARLVKQFLVEKDIQEKLISEIAPRLSDRNSGYTSIVKIGRRQGDGASVVRMSFVAGTGVKPSAKKSEEKEEVKAEAKVAKEEKKAAPKVKKAIKKEDK